MDDNPDTKPQAKPQRLFTVRLPGFINENPVGLGDVVQYMTSQIGIRPCGGCAHRTAALNRWLVFAGRRNE
jgi:hypothetical protein